MGKLRARNDTEVTARRCEILDAAAELLSEKEFEDITLAVIAEKTSMSRPSMYNYYETKEEVFVELMSREYAKWETDIKQAFSEKYSRPDFCRKMVDILWNRQLLLKLLSLHSSALARRCNDELIYQFEKNVQPFFITLSEILEFEFPNSTKAARDMFKIQLTIYCNSIYALTHIPEMQMNAIKEFDLYGDIPSEKNICFEGLMLLTANLE